MGTLDQVAEELMPTSATTSEFDLDLTDSLGRLRVYALSLTRNGDRADDLVQQTVLKALAGRESFRPGSNFAGWIFRIQRNEFISELRRTRPIVDVFGEMARVTSVAPRQESGLVLREFVRALRYLPQGSRQALLLAELEGLSYQQIADHAGVAQGTVKSRISRGRAALAELLDRPATGHRSSPHEIHAQVQPSSAAHAAVRQSAG
jgi:RNA polymerase sigma-70 factor (ECF subfamily)